MIPCMPNVFKSLHIRVTERYKKLSCEYWLYTLQKSKVRKATNHGEKFRSNPAASFSGIIHSFDWSILSPCNDSWTGIGSKYLWRDRGQG